MDNSTSVTMLKNMFVLNLDVSIWTARKKLSPEDFGGAKLPPEELATLGSKRVCNPDDLRIFSTLKSRAVSMLDRIGVRFLGGWGIPISKAKELSSELQKIQSEFVAAKIDFLNCYDQSVSSWLAQNGEWENIIKNSTVSADYVSARIGFDWQIFQLATPKKSALHDGLRNEVSKLGSKLYVEIAKAAEETWKKCYSGKTQVSQKALSPLRSIYEKLSGLSFVEPSALPVSNLLQTAFDTIPNKGFIKGADLVMLQGILAMLRDPVSMCQHGYEIINGVSPDSILTTLVHTETSEETELNDTEIAKLNQQAIDSLGLW